MSGHTEARDGSAARNDLDAVKARLELLEEALASGTAIDPTLVHELTSALCADMRNHANRSAPEAALCRRIDRALSLGHLRARETPEPLLARLTDDILEQTVILDHAAPGSAAEAARRADLRRAHMSRAFLDAPRSLHVWRATGMAACLLLGALTVVWTQSAWSPASNVPERGSRERPLSTVRSQPVALPGSSDEEEAARARRRFLGGALDRFAGMSRTVGDGAGTRTGRAPAAGSHDRPSTPPEHGAHLNGGGATTSWGVERAAGSFPLNDTRSVERALRRLFPDAPVKARNDANDIEFN